MSNDNSPAYLKIAREKYGLTGLADRAKRMVRSPIEGRDSEAGVGIPQ
jgi:hypothetical protein